MHVKKRFWRENTMSGAILAILDHCTIINPVWQKLKSSRDVCGTAIGGHISPIYESEGKNVITGNSFFLVSLRKKEIGEKQCWYNPELECALVQVDRQ
ncbi:hypothetical protein ABFA07_004320 [Porites harrisoni]